MAAGAGVDAEHLIDDVHRGELPLLQKLHHPVATVEALLGGSVEVGAELGESLELAEARQIEAETTGNLLHRLRLGGTTDARHRDADVHGRTLAGEEEIGLEVDLAVGDRDHVGGDVRRNFPFERLDDRQRRQRTTAELAGELRRPLEETAVGVEHVARVGLTSRRTTHEERQLAVGRGLFGEIVINDQRMLAFVHEIFGHRRARVRGDVLERGCGGGAGHDHGRVVHGAVLSQRVDGHGDRRILLADGDVKALHAAVLLVDDRVDADRRFAGLAVANNQLALAAADRRHRVDRLDAGLERLADR